MIRYCISLGLVLLFSTYSCNAQKSERNLLEVRFSTALLKASTVAYNQFLRDQPSADVSNFSVLVQEFDTYVEVNFLPNHGPVREGIEDDKAYVEIPNPHGNKYGRAVGYNVEKRSGKILKIFYSK